MLAVVSCLKFWEPELKSCGPFTIWTDHKNLEYFMVKRQLSERQIRWYETLTKFQFSLVYRPGAEAILPDALSRREQDTLGEEDKISRFRRFLNPDRAPNWPGSAETKGVEVATSSIQMYATQFPTDTDKESLETVGPFQEPSLNDLWHTTEQGDSLYQAVSRSVTDGSRLLPPNLKVKIQIGDCAIDRRGYLRHRGKL